MYCVLWAISIGVGHFSSEHILNVCWSSSGTIHVGNSIDTELMSTESVTFWSVWLFRLLFGSSFQSIVPSRALLFESSHLFFFWPFSAWICSIYVRLPFLGFSFFLALSIALCTAANFEFDGRFSDGELAIHFFEREDNRRRFTNSGMRIPNSAFEWFCHYRRWPCFPVAPKPIAVRWTLDHLYGRSTSLWDRWFWGYCRLNSMLSFIGWHHHLKL